MQTCVVLTLRTCRFLVKCSNAHVVVWVPPPARDSQLTPVQALPDRLFELYGLTEGPHTVLDRSCVLSKVCWAAGLLLQEMNNPHGHESSKNSNHQRRYDTLALRCVGPNTIRVLKCLFGRFLVDVPNNPLPQSLQSETVDLDFMFNPVFMQYVLFLQLNDNLSVTTLKQNGIFTDERVNWTICNSKDWMITSIGMNWTVCNGKGNYCCFQLWTISALIHRDKTYQWRVNEKEG